QQCRALQRHANRAPAHRRIFLLGLAQIGQHLVGADVEGAEDDRLSLGLAQDGRIVPHLRAEAREVVGHHELQFSAVKADAVSALAWPIAGMPRARATIATWLVRPPSSSTTPRSLARS